MSEFGGTKPIRVDCPACYERIEVAFDQRYSTLTCPRCGRPVQLANHQIFWVNLKQIWWPKFTTRCSERARVFWANLRQVYWPRFRQGSLTLARTALHRWRSWREKCRAKRAERLRRIREAEETRRREELAITRAQNIRQMEGWKKSHGKKNRVGLIIVLVVLGVAAYVLLHFYIRMQQFSNLKEEWKFGNEMYEKRIQEVVKGYERGNYSFEDARDRINELSDEREREIERTRDRYDRNK